MWSGEDWCAHYQIDSIPSHLEVSACGLPSRKMGLHRALLLLPPFLPSPLVSGACRVRRLVRGVSSVSRFSLGGPSSYMGLGWGMTPPFDAFWQGKF